MSSGEKALGSLGPQSPPAPLPVATPATEKNTAVPTPSPVTVKEEERGSLPGKESQGDAAAAAASDSKTVADIDPRKNVTPQKDGSSPPTAPAKNDVGSPPPPSSPPAPVSKVSEQTPPKESTDNPTEIDKTASNSNISGQPNDLKTGQPLSAPSGNEKGVSTTQTNEQPSSSSGQKTDKINKGQTVVQPEPKKEDINPPPLAEVKEVDPLAQKEAKIQELEKSLAELQSKYKNVNVQLSESKASVDILMYENSQLHQENEALLKVVNSFKLLETQQNKTGRGAPPENKSKVTNLNKFLNMGGISLGDDPTTGEGAPSKSKNDEPDGHKTNEKEAVEVEEPSIVPIKSYLTTDKELEISSSGLSQEEELEGLRREVAEYRENYVKILESFKILKSVCEAAVQELEGWRKNKNF